MRSALFLIVLSTGFLPATAALPEPKMPELPFFFVENKGQADQLVRFTGSGPGFSALFTCAGVHLRQGAAQQLIRFVGGSDCPEMKGTGPSEAHANYLLGADPKDWVVDAPVYSGVLLNSVWKGIDVRFQAAGSAPKAEYEVRPGAHPEEIRLHFDGTAQITPDGGLTVRNESGLFHEDAPFIYQMAGLRKERVAGTYSIDSEGLVGFKIDKYDESRALVIDPTILFSGLFGGASQTTLTSVAVNADYNTIVAGWTAGSGLPTSAGARHSSGGGVEAFIASFSPVNGALVYCTYLGGSGDDRAFGLAVDSLNNTYVTGWTSSSNFPVSSGVQSRLSGPRDAFIAKLNPAGNSFVYSAYLGGSGSDSGTSIAVDSDGSAVLAGDTTSLNLQVSPQAVQRISGGGQDGFVAKLNPAGSALTYLTYFGGGSTDHVAALKLDAAHAIYIGGSTYSTNLPVANAFQPFLGGGQDGFAAKLDLVCNCIRFSTYIGGAGGSAGAPEEVSSLAVGSESSVTLAGSTSSWNFPVSAVTLQSQFGGGNTDGFVTRLNSNTGALTRSTYFGGSGDDGIKSVAVDYTGIIVVAGFTTSTDFTVKDAVQSVSGGAMDAFVARFTFSQLYMSTFLGGSANDCANSIALDSLGSIVVVGTTSSSNYPVVRNPGVWAGASLSSFFTKIAPNFTLGLAAPPVFYVDSYHNSGFNGPNSVTLSSTAFGQAGDIPLVGDWTNSRVKKIGVFRNGLWLLDSNGNGVFDGADKIVSFGQAGDIPVVGDWTGDGLTKLGLFRQGTFILDLSGHLSGTSTGLSDLSFSFGSPGDLPIVADWNFSGSSKVGVFRRGEWLVDYNGDHQFDGRDQVYTYGQSGDIPVVGEWDSSGRLRIGVYRNGNWILNYLGYNSIVSGGKYEMYIGFGSSAFSPLVF